MKKIIPYTLLLAFPVAVFCQSIPKRKAMDISANIKMENSRMLQRRSFDETSYPAIALKIKL